MHEHHTHRDTPSERSVHERARLTADGAADPGDRHDKGEQSLCIGEAA